MILLAGDVGGTNTRLLLAERIAAVTKVLFEKDYSSLDYADFYSVLRKFLRDSNVALPIDGACIGLAGPVEGETASVTNLPWVIEKQKLSDLLITPNVALMNDFVAVSHGVSLLEENDFITIQHGTKPRDRDHRLNSVIIGAGTGLGVSCKTWVDNHYHIVSSETGHTDFSPANELQAELLIWLQKKYAQVNLESLLSGRGFKTIYEFLRDVKNIPESYAIKAAIDSGNVAKTITDNALQHSDELCEKTLDCFVQIYGTAAGNAALNYYPVDEVYIAGGIAPKIKEKINSSLFLDAFNQKGLMTSNMKKISIKLITQDRVGLYGALSTLYKL